MVLKEKGKSSKSAWKKKKKKKNEKKSKEKKAQVHLTSSGNKQDYLHL
jgi:hypothetical protein